MKKIWIIVLAFFACHAGMAQHIGIGTDQPKARLHVADSSVLFSAEGDAAQQAGLPPASGKGRRMMWYADKAAFRSGGVLSTEWDKDSIGNYSFATGRWVKAKGWNSLAGGYEAFSMGNASVALGYRSKAFEDKSYSFGYEVQALSPVSFVFGGLSKAHAYGSTAMGFYADAEGEYSMALNGGTAMGDYSSTIGTTRAVSYRSIALGAYNDTLSGTSRTEWIWTDPLLIVGNGVQYGPRSNALLILKNGNIGIGTNTIQARTHIAYNSSLVNPQLLLEETANDYVRLSFKNSSTNNLWTIAANPQATWSTAQMNFHYGSIGDILQLYGNGNAWLKGTLAQNSDSRLKKNVQPIDNALSQLQQLNGYRYQWKDSTRDTTLQLGVLAQEVQSLLPELVSADSSGILSVNYIGLIPLLINAVKEQSQQVQELQLQNKEMRRRLDVVERVMDVNNNTKVSVPGKTRR